MLGIFLSAFIPLFVAIDPVGTLPLYMGLTEGYAIQEKRRLALHAVTTSLVVGVTFGSVGQVVFNMLGITTADFQIGGGLLLLIFSVREIFGVSSKVTEGQTTDRLLGVVPLGIPLITGPATITTLLILHETHNFMSVTTALIVNLLIVFFIFFFSDQIIKMIGEVTPKVVAKINAIFLAAIAVMMIRKGLEAIILRNPM